MRRQIARDASHPRVHDVRPDNLALLGVGRHAIRHLGWVVVEAAVGDAAEASFCLLGTIHTHPSCTKIVP
jgi:hypothetical protein